MHREVRTFETFGVEIEGVGVLHDEFPRAHHAEPRADLVAELRLDLVEVDRELLVAAELPASDVRDDLFMGRADTEVALVAVLQAQQLGTEIAPASGLLPQLGGLHGGHQHLLGASRVHLLANDGLDLAQHAHADRQPRVETGREQANQAGPEHQPMADDLRLRRRFPHRREKRLRASHWRDSLEWLASAARAGGVRGRCTTTNPPGPPVPPHAAIVVAACPRHHHRSRSFRAGMRGRTSPERPPGSAGVPPAPGRRPAMDDPPKAHRCVQAGKPAPAWGRRGMPALPGGVRRSRRLAWGDAK